MNAQRPGASGNCDLSHCVVKTDNVCHNVVCTRNSVS